MRSIILLAIFDISTAAIVQQALMWQKTNKMEMIERGEYSAYVKYRSPLRSSSLITASQRVGAWGDPEFVGNITIGTPAQQFSVLVDTGSADVWVPGIECDESCGSKHRFDPGLSSTFVSSNRTYSIPYAKAEAELVLGNDIMKLGGVDEKQLEVPNTPFGRAKHVSTTLKQDFFDGILGLAFTALSYSKAMPPLMNIIDQRLLDAPLFTIWLPVYGNSRNTANGLITYGAINTENCGPLIAYEPFSSEIFAIGIGFFTYMKICDAASDSGTSFIGGPKAVIDSLAEAGGAVYNATKDLYILECNYALFTLDITIGAITYPIHPENYVVKIDEKDCYFNFFAIEAPGFGVTWMLGSPFIRQYCHIFNIGQNCMGFALSLKS